MNNIEKDRLQIAKKLVEECGAIGYKTSFEDEGATSQDIARAKIVTEKANLPLNIKIGGCEAIADIKEAKTLGAKAIVAPMIETPYAAQKFVSAIKKVYEPEEIEDLEVAINIESITGAQNIEKILEAVKDEKIISRVTVGRVDLIGSMGMKRDEINSDVVFEQLHNVLSVSKTYNMVTGMGGGIDKKTIQFIKRLGHLLDYYETRYIIFENIKNKTEEEMLEGILNAQKFEANYYEDLSSRYKQMSSSNLERFEMIKARINKAEETLNK